MNNKENEMGKESIRKLALCKELVDSEIKAFFKKQLSYSKKIDKTAYQAIKALEEYNLRGGKRIRAALTLYSFQCFSKNKPNNELIKASIAMELVQSFLLIHDDIIDRDEIRRGRDTMHKIFEKIGESDFAFKDDNKEREHFGGAMAILVGDICAALANIVMLEVNFKNKVRAINEINKVIRDVNFGQIIDVRSGYCDIYFRKSISMTLKTYKLKTATYSIEIPLKIGAILAGAKDQEITKIKEYAEPLGIAYNIQDDLLGLFGERSKFGKPIGSDLIEGKKTLVILKALEKATEEEKKFIMKNLGNKNISSKDIEKIKSIIIKTGAFDYCKKYAKKLIIKSKNIISKQKYRKEGEFFILGICDYLLDRDY